VSPWLRLARLHAPHKTRVLLALSLAVLACLFSLASPLLVEQVLTRAGERHGLAVLLAPALMLLVVVMVQAVASTGNSWLLATVALDVVRSLRRQLYEQLQRMPLAWFDRTPTGAIMSRLTEDVSVVQNLASGQTLVTLLDISTAIAAAGWLASRSWKLAAVVLCIAPLYIVVFRLFTRHIHTKALDVRAQLDRVFGHLKQKIDGMQVVRATAVEPQEISQFTRQIGELHQPRLRVNQLGIAFSNLCVGMGGIGASAVFAVGAWEVIAGRLSVGELIAASALAGLLFTPITRLSELASTYQQALASFLRLSEILDYPLAVQLSENCSHHPTEHGFAPAGRIEFDHLDFHYVPDRPVLKDVSLRIEPGTKVAIVGPTGSGKTTLMNLLLRFYEPTGGTIRIDGRAVGDFSLPALRQHIGVVPQEAVIFRGTLADNIRYGTPHASTEQITAAASAALVHEMALDLPQQYETLVGEGGHPLSQGQRQRIALARIFCKDPSIVVLDEATSSLDRPNEVLVQQALDRLLAGRTTFVIAHRLATILRADKIVVMDQGRIVQVGTHQELLDEADGLYRQLYDCQFAPVAAEAVGPGPRSPGPATPAVAAYLESIPA
jgi:ABC-type multidrug transport system fused ATPase/permease subunit